MEKRTTLPSGVLLVESTYDGGAAEVSAYAFTGDQRKLVAVASRQISGGKWCIATLERSRAALYRLKRDALTYLGDYAAKRMGAI